MDECWEAGKKLLRRDRGICLDCHDECIPKSPAGHSRISARNKRATGRVDPRLLFARQGL